MVISFLRESRWGAALLTLVRLYLGFIWLISGFKNMTKIYDVSWYIKSAIANPVTGTNGDAIYGWYIAFLKSVALPNVKIFNFIIPISEFLIGLGLIVGCLTTLAAFTGFLMHSAFFLSGTVSSHPIDLLLVVIILIAGYNAGRYGLDKWVIPYLRTTFFDKGELSAILRP